MKTSQLVFVTIFLGVANVLLCASFLVLTQNTRNAYARAKVPIMSRGNVRLLSTDGKGPVIGNYVGAPWRQENQWWAWHTQTGGMQATPALVVFEEAPASPGKP